MPSGFLFYLTFGQERRKMKNDTKIKANVEALADVAFEKLDDNNTVIDNQICYDSTSVQIFRIEKDHTDAAKFSKKDAMCIK